VTKFSVLRGAETLPYLPWLNKLYKREESKNESLGFIPYQTYEREAPLGRIWIALLGGEAIGFIYSGAILPNKDARILRTGGRLCRECKRADDRMRREARR